MGRLLAQQGIALLPTSAAEGPAGALRAEFRSAAGVELSAEDSPTSADAAIALPGGPLSLQRLLDEQLGPLLAAGKPCGLLNARDYFTEVFKTMEDALVERVVRETQRGCLIVQRDPAELIRAMQEFRPPERRPTLQ